MSNTFETQTGIVTGAASGLGAAIASRLAAQGVKLALLDRDISGLEKVRASIGQDCGIFALDLTNEDDVERVTSEIAGLFGRIDLLVNCAGVTGETNIKSHEVKSDNVKHVFDVNFMGSFYTSKYAIPYMLKNNYGRILHIASISGKEGNAGMLAYSASKAAVIGMTKVQGKEYAETGITVNALAPAVIQTAMVEALPDEQVSYMSSKIPMKRCGKLDEAADMSVFIVSPECSFTTGFTFDLSGGRATY